MTKTEQQEVKRLAADAVRTSTQIHGRAIEAEAAWETLATIYTDLEVAPLDPKMPEGFEVAYGHAYFDSLCVRFRATFPKGLTA